MAVFRQANPRDITQIQQIEKEYYEGFSLPVETLKSWVERLPENFIVAEEDSRVVGFIFFEYVNEIRPIPFVHKVAHSTNGKYSYVSEIGVVGRPRDSGILEGLVDKMIEKSKGDGCGAVVWLAGTKGRHDRIETGILIESGFEKKGSVKHWEAWPDHFVDDHFIWVKNL